MSKNENRLNFRMTDETAAKIERWYQEDNCRSKNEFIEKAVNCYVDTLAAGESTTLPRAVQSAIDARLKLFEDRIASLLYKQAVEMDMAMSILLQSVNVDEEVLRQAIETDEGAHYLGEIALVPVDSPIAQSGLLFYNTLFDENAACHFAFGQAYPACVPGGDDLPEEELVRRGINVVSTMHVDFMVGTEDLSIIGTTKDGREVALTALEFDLLAMLVRRSNVALSREALLSGVWGYAYQGETRTVDVHIQRLRGKIGAEYIETVYKYGYRFCGEGEGKP